jgi:hypothetical protein
VNSADLQRGIAEPASFAANQAKKMMGAGNPIATSQTREAGSVPCASCGGHHRLGTVCSKSFENALDILKAKAKHIVSQPKGNRGGNPYHDSSTGKFTSTPSSAKGKKAKPSHEAKTPSGGSVATQAQPSSGPTIPQPSAAPTSTPEAPQVQPQQPTQSPAPVVAPMPQVSQAAPTPYMAAADQAMPSQMPYAAPQRPQAHPMQQPTAQPGHAPSDHGSAAGHKPHGGERLMPGSSFQSGFGTGQSLGTAEGGQAAHQVGHLAVEGAHHLLNKPFEQKKNPVTRQDQMKQLTQNSGHLNQQSANYMNRLRAWQAGNTGV